MTNREGSPIKPKFCGEEGANHAHHKWNPTNKSPEDFYPVATDGDVIWECENCGGQTPAPIGAPAPDKDEYPMWTSGGEHVLPPISNEDDEDDN